MRVIANMDEYNPAKTEIESLLFHLKQRIPLYRTNAQTYRCTRSSSISPTTSATTTINRGFDASFHSGKSKSSSTTALDCNHSMFSSTEGESGE